MPQAGYYGMPEQSGLMGITSQQPQQSIDIPNLFSDYHASQQPVLGQNAGYVPEAAIKSAPQQMPDMREMASQYQALQAMGRPDLAQQVMQQAGLPEASTLDTVKSVLLGTPNAGLSSGASLTQSMVPLLMGLYKDYQNKQQWQNNPAMMQGVAGGQLTAMQNQFGLTK